MNDVIYHVTKTITTDPITSIMINYHTDYPETYLLYTKETSTFQDAIKIKPKEIKWSMKNLANVTPNSSFNNERYVCYALLDQLQPNTKYKYMVVAPNGNSAVYYFKTQKEGSFKIIAFCDLQYAYNDESKKLIKMIERDNPDATLAIGSGDLVDFADREGEWFKILDEGPFANLTLGLAAGDHEYWGDATNGYKQLAFPYSFCSLFHFPSNGAKSSIGTNYYVLFNRTLFVFLDMQDSNTTRNARLNEQEEWFKALIKQKLAYDYLIVIMHKSLFGSALIDTSVAKNLRPIWAKIFHDAHVDLVISGHDHIYSRTYPLAFINKARKNGTIYLDLGSSGTKRRSLDDSLIKSTKHRLVYDLKVVNESATAIMEINQEYLQVKIYNNKNIIIDEFKIKKSH